MIARVLTVAGSDSGGGAGIQADLKTFTALGVYGMSVITALTAQNTLRVYEVEPVPPEFVGLQMEAVLSDIGADAMKTGMLFNAGIVQTVSEKIRSSRIAHVVVDPVMVAKSGDRLLEEDAVEVFKSRLLPLATLVTPNQPEAEILSGLRLHSEEDIQKAAHRILQMGCKAVLIKGGHGVDKARDILFDGNEFLSFTEERIQTLNTHGTGCTLSAAIAAHLAMGFSLEAAVSRGKRYVTEAIRNALELGRGHGPLNHMVSLS